jgi:hypothetical protein
MVSRVLTIEQVTLRLVTPAGVHHISTMPVFGKIVPGIRMILEDQNGSSGVGARSKVVVKMSVHSSIITNQAESTRAFS